MKKNRLFFIAFLFLLSCGTENEDSKKSDDSTNETTENTSSTHNENVSSPQTTDFISGDVIFQTSLSNQSVLLEKATQSPFTHCGVILKQNDQYFVLEANGSVRQTPIENWIAGGKEGKYVVMRFIYSDKFQSKDAIDKSIITIKKKMNLPYDTKFMWNDTEMYCSELVWKLFQESTTIELCPLKKLKEYDLSSNDVQGELKKIYGANIPLEETMVAPGDLASSDYLKMIYSNY